MRRGKCRGGRREGHDIEKSSRREDTRTGIRRYLAWASAEDMKKQKIAMGEEMRRVRIKEGRRGEVKRAKEITGRRRGEI